eukprot:2272386-Rhodomonas_salina.1
MAASQTMRALLSSEHMLQTLGFFVMVQNPPTFLRVSGTGLLYAAMAGLQCMLLSARRCPVLTWALLLLLLLLPGAATDPHHQHLC